MGSRFVTVETTNAAFGIGENIPERAWRPWGRARTVRGLIRVYRRAYRWTHPQPGQDCWTGHVRIISPQGLTCSVADAIALLGYTDTLAEYQALPFWAQPLIDRA